METLIKHTMRDSRPATRPLELTGFYSSPNLALQFRGLFLDCFQECEPLLAPHRDLGAVFRVKNPQEALKTIDDITQSGSRVRLSRRT